MLHLLRLLISLIEIEHREVKLFINLNYANSIEKLLSSGFLRRIKYYHFYKTKCSIGFLIHLIDLSPLRFRLL